MEQLISVDKSRVVNRFVSNVQAFPGPSSNKPGPLFGFPKALGPHLRILGSTPIPLLRRLSSFFSFKRPSFRVHGWLNAQLRNVTQIYCPLALSSFATPHPFPRKRERDALDSTFRLSLNSNPDPPVTWRKYLSRVSALLQSPPFPTTPSTLMLASDVDTSSTST